MGAERNLILKKYGGGLYNDGSKIKKNTYSPLRNRDGVINAESYNLINLHGKL